MKAPFVVAISATLLTSSASLATAANVNNMSKSSASMPEPADSLSLKASQQKTVWKDISSQATKEIPAIKFTTAKVGVAVPKDVAIHPVPVSTANKVPAVRPYDYALLNGKKLLIVNPSDRRVAEIITQ
jgi:Flp pilus assembly protein TadD